MLARTLIGPLPVLSCAAASGYWTILFELISSLAVAWVFLLRSQSGLFPIPLLHDFGVFGQEGGNIRGPFVSSLRKLPKEKRHFESLSRHLPYVPRETTIENRGRDSLLISSSCVSLSVFLFRIVHQILFLKFPKFFSFLPSEKKKKQTGKRVFFKKK